ncbi:MAG: T9SS type A sorting domain-containing protein [Sphingobacteriales bacterium]|nr:T9SS type A sorting domain-containing protein [Sphingobacteriales bacterium]
MLLLAFGTSAQVRSGNSGDATIKMVKYYPNPAITVINFEFQKNYDKSYSFQIYNFVGKKVYELQNVNQKNTINLDQFNRGVYIYQLRDQTGKILEAGKFQVVK